MGVGLGLIAVFYLLSFYFESFIGIFNITVLFSIPAAIVAFYGNYLSSALVAVSQFFNF